MMMFKKWLVLFLITFCMLSACNSPVYNQTEANIADVALKTQAARHHFDHAGRHRSALLIKKGLYVDATPINIDSEPYWLRNHIVIRGDQLPFSYYSRTIAAGGGGNILTKYQVALDPTVRVSMNYSGPIKGALDLLATKAGYVYSIRRNTVYWQSFITRTYDIAFMPGSTDYLMGKASTTTTTAAATTSGGTTFVSSDTSTNEYSNLKGTLSIWRDLDATIRQLLTPEGKVMVSESTTSVTVRDKPTNVELVGQYISNLNHNLSKQVLVKVQVLEVNLENDWQFGINWQSIIRAFNKSPFVVNANYGTPVSITAFTPQANITGAALPSPQFGIDQSQNPASAGGPGGLPSYTILFNALSQQGKTAVVSEPRVMCLNNQVSVVRIVQQEAYVASVQNTTLANAGTGAGSATTNVGTVTSQITPGNLVTGVTLYILPKILRDNIYLQVNADFSVKDDLVDFVSGTSTVQLPKITEKHFNQRSMIRSGDTLILSGFRQVTNTANANQFVTSQALGGKGAQQISKETIILITPIVLHGSA